MRDCELALKQSMIIGGIETGQELLSGSMATQKQK